MTTGSISQKVNSRVNAALRFVVIFQSCLASGCSSNPDEQKLIEERLLGLSLMGVGTSQNNPGAVAIGRTIVDSRAPSQPYSDNRSSFEAASDRKLGTTLGEAVTAISKATDQKYAFRRAQLVNAHGLLLYTPNPNTKPEEGFPSIKDVFGPDDTIVVSALYTLPLQEKFVFITVSSPDSDLAIAVHGNSLNVEPREASLKSTKQYSGAFDAGPREERLEIEFDARGLRDRLGNGSAFVVGLYLLDRPTAEEFANGKIDLRNPLISRSFAIRDFGEPR